MRISLICIFLLGLGLQGKSQTIVWSAVSNPLPRATYDVTFSSDGTKALSGTECQEARLRMYDTNNGSILWDYLLDSNLFCVMGVRFAGNGDKFVALEETGKLLVFEVIGGTPQIVDTIDGNTNVALSADINDAGTQVLMGCNNALKIYDLNTGTLTASIPAHSGFIWATAYSEDEQKIITGGSDNTAKIWSVTGALLHNLNASNNDILSACFSKDDSLAVVAGRDDQIRIYSVATGSLLNTLSGHSGDINKVDVSSDNRFIASASSDATVRIWEISSGIELINIPDSANSFMYSVKWDPNGSRILTGNGDSKITLYDLNAVTGLPQTVFGSSLLISPNPARQNEMLRIVGSDRGLSAVELFDMSGRLVKSAVVPGANETSVSLGGLSAGSYWVRIQAQDGNVSSLKLVVN